MGYKIGLEYIIIIMLLYLIMIVHTLYSCCNVQKIKEKFTGKTEKKLPSAKGKEGFTGGILNDGESAEYRLGNYAPVNTSSWFSPSLVVSSGQPTNSAVSDIVNRKNTKLPLKEGEMFLFQDTDFKPECCPNTYSNSMGCACMNTKTYNYLQTRGGNNVPYSEY